MSTSRIMKWVTGGLEALLGIPVLGGMIVLSLLWVPLGVMLVLHIITLMISKNEGKELRGSVLGIITSCIAWIPIVGMIMHIVTAVILMIDAAKSEQAALESPSQNI